MTRKGKILNIRELQKFLAIGGGLQSLLTLAPKAGGLGELPVLYLGHLD